jgi:hypothetical protein
MSTPEETTYSLPTAVARRRLIAGRLVAGVFAFNTLFAILGGWLLSGPGTWISRVEMGFWAWAGALFLGSALLSVPLVGATLFKLLNPPPEAPEKS